MNLAKAWLFFAMFLLVPGVKASSDCPATWINVDPPNDIMVMGLESPQLPLFPPAIDILSATLVKVEDSLEYSLELAAPPEFGSELSYRYWLGFHVTPVGGEPEYMDLRIAQTTAYDFGALVSSIETGLIGLGQIPVTWDGAKASASIPTSLVQGVYPDPIEFGIPEAGAEGRSVGTNAQGFVVGAFLFDYTPLGPTEPLPCAESMASAATGPASTPGLGTPVGVLVAVGGFLVRRRNLQ